MWISLIWKAVATLIFFAADGETGIEVECKTVGYDKGRRIHRFDFERLSDRLLPLLMLGNQQQTGSMLLRLLLPGRLKPSDEIFDEIERLATQALVEPGVEFKDEGSSAIFKPIDLGSLPPDRDQLMSLVEEILGHSPVSSLHLRYSKVRDRVCGAEPPARLCGGQHVSRTKEGRIAVHGQRPVDVVGICRWN
jgi:hypothetical protein